jgi:ubiquinone biosynthesis protein UbiJ
MIDFSQPVPSPVPAPGSAEGRSARAGRGTARPLGGAPLSAILAALNHLLAQQAWARERLRAFAGRTVRLGVEPSAPMAAWVPELHARIDAEGSLVAAADGPADVSLWLRPSVDALFRGLAQGPQGLSGHLRVEGDVLLAGVLGELAARLRPDVEEDLSRVTGDVIARRVLGGLRAVRDEARASRGRLERSATEYLTVEQPQLAGAAALREFGDAVQALAGDVDRLAGRLAALQRRR